MDYKDKLKLAKEALDSGSYDKETIEFIFPELKESEDEKIKGAIIDHLKDNNLIEWAAWLEKQGNKPQGKTAFDAIKEEKLDNTNEIEPKFHEGEWIISKWGGIYQIKEIMSGSYNLLCTNNAEEINSITQVDNNSRLLCISDIKKLEEQSKKKNVDVESLSKTILASHGEPFEKPKWTEEDECYMSECIGAIATKDGWSFEEKRKTKHWLKSLKQRMNEQ